MGDDNENDQSSDVAREAIRTLNEALGRFNEQIDIAADWIGTIPALPNNEVRQVVAHVLQMSLAFADQTVETIAIEQIRAQKHLALAMFDCVSVLNRFHFAALNKMVLDSQQRHDAATRYILRELDRLSQLQASLPDPPSGQRGTLPASNQEILLLTKADKDQIDQLTLAQQQIARDLEQLYRVFEKHLGAELLKELFQAIRSDPLGITKKK